MKTLHLENNKCGDSTGHSMHVGVATMLAISALFILYLAPAYAVEPIVEWDFGGHTFFECAAGGICFFTITDPAANLKPEVVNTITATVSSIDPFGIVRDEIEITLSEAVSEDDPAFFDENGQPVPTAPDPNSGIFRIKNIIFSNGALAGEKEYSLDNTITFDVDDSGNYFGAFPDFYGPISDGSIDTINSAFSLFSSSDLETFLDGFPITETDLDTQIYTGTLRFSTESSDFESGTILVQPGDILSIQNTISKSVEAIKNSLIVPNPDPTVGIIEAEIGDSVIVTYNGIECDPFDLDLLCNTEIVSAGSPGGGSGGPVIPSMSLVVDVLGFFGGGEGAGGLLNTGSGGPDHSPPSLISSNPSILANLFADPFKPISPTTNPTAPLRINDEGYFPTGKTTTINPIQLSPGDNIDLTLSFLEATSVQHVALYFVDENSDELSDTDPAIIYDNGNVIKSDPHGMLGDQITFTKSREGFRSIFNFGFSIDEPTNRHLGIVVWDEKRNSATTNIRNAFSVSGEPVPQEVNHLVLSDLGQYIITQDGVIDMQAQRDTIPQQQAAWFYSDSIGRLDRHDMTSLHNTIDDEQARAGTIIDNFNLDTVTFVADDEKKPYDISKRAPQLTWSNVGHKLRSMINTPDENKELLKQLLWQEHLKAEKTLKAYLEQRNHRE